MKPSHFLRVTRFSVGQPAPNSVDRQRSPEFVCTEPKPSRTGLRGIRPWWAKGERWGPSNRACLQHIARHRSPRLPSNRCLGQKNQKDQEQKAQEHRVSRNLAILQLRTPFPHSLHRWRHQRSHSLTSGQFVKSRCFANQLSQTLEATLAGVERE